jgi:hypothetical protein
MIINTEEKKVFKAPLPPKKPPIKQLQIEESKEFGKVPKYL